MSRSSGLLRVARSERFVTVMMLPEGTMERDYDVLVNASENAASSG
jgi:hypothetical protein